MRSNQKMKLLYTLAYEFLVSKIGQVALEQRLNHYRQYKAETMEDVFWYLLNSLTNKVGMRATIGDIDALEPYLFNFDPYRTHSHYQVENEKITREKKAFIQEVRPILDRI